MANVGVFRDEGEATGGGFIDASGERHLLLERLMERFERLRKQGPPGLVVIKGEAGIGKTRIVQEFYRRLAEREENSYWPRELVPGPAGDLLTQRKRVQPGAFRSEGRPEWIWWGVSCQLGAGGEPLQALADAQAQLYEHCADYLEAQARRDQAQDNLRRVAKVAASALLSITGGSQVLEGLSTLKDVCDLINDIRANSRNPQRGAQQGASGPADNARAQLADHLEELIVSFGESELRLPFVIVLDDAHDADEGAVRLVDGLLRRLTLPVMIVATARTEGLERTDGNRGIGELLESPLWRDSDQVEVAEIPRFSAEEAAELIDGAAPHTSEAVRDALVARAGGNPLVLRWTLGLEKVRGSIRGGAITLDAGEIATLPASVGAVFASRWEQLGRDVQKALALASVQGRRFLPRVVARTAGSYAALDARAAQEALEQARRQGVIRSLGGEQRCGGAQAQDGGAPEVCEFANEADVELAAENARGVLRGRRSELLADTWRELDAVRKAHPGLPAEPAKRTVLDGAVRLACDPAASDLEIVAMAVARAGELIELEWRLGLPDAAIATGERRVALVERLHGFPSAEALEARIGHAWEARQLGAYQHGLAHAEVAFALAGKRHEAARRRGLDATELAELKVGAARVVSCLCCDIAGELRFRLGQRGEARARELWLRSIEMEEQVRRTTEDPDELAQALLNLGIYHRCIGTREHLEKAMGCHERLQLAPDEEDWGRSVRLEARLTEAELAHGSLSVEAARAMLELANHYLGLGSLAQADYHYRRARQVLEKGPHEPATEHPDELARAYLGIGWVEIQRGRRLRARDACNSARKVSRMARDPRGELALLIRDLAEALAAEAAAGGG